MTYYKYRKKGSNQKWKVIKGEFVPDSRSWHAANDLKRLSRTEEAKIMTKSEVKQVGKYFVKKGGKYVKKTFKSTPTTKYVKKKGTTYKTFKTKEGIVVIPVQTTKKKKINLKGKVRGLSEKDLRRVF